MGPTSSPAALAALPVALFEFSLGVWLVVKGFKHFGFDICILTYLVLRSRFLPRAIGVLLAIDGLAYLVYSFTNFLAPGVAATLVPWIQLPALFREGSLCLCLLVVGVDVQGASSVAPGSNRTLCSERLPGSLNGKCIRRRPGVGRRSHSELEASRP